MWPLLRHIGIRRLKKRIGIAFRQTSVFTVIREPKSKKIRVERRNTRIESLKSLALQRVKSNQVLRKLTWRHVEKCLAGRQERSGSKENLEPLCVTFCMTLFLQDRLAVLPLIG
jgi:hypothetical protein